MPTTAKKPPARERILQTADDLFYAEGIHTVGIDRIIAEAGVAKMTLYNHFPSKDDLVLAVLERREASVFEFFQSSVAKYRRKGKDAMTALFDTLGDWFRQKTFRGCAFINASAELPLSHPAFDFVREHKTKLHHWIRELIEEEYADIPPHISEGVAVLLEGAIVTARIQNDPNAAKTAKQTAVAMLNAVQGNIKKPHVARQDQRSEQSE